MRTHRCMQRKHACMHAVWQAGEQVGWLAGGCASGRAGRQACIHANRPARTHARTHGSRWAGSQAGSQADRQTKGGNVRVEPHASQGRTHAHPSAPAERDGAGRTDGTNGHGTSSSCRIKGCVWCRQSAPSPGHTVSRGLRAVLETSFGPTRPNGLRFSAGRGRRNAPSKRRAGNALRKSGITI